MSMGKGKQWTFFCHLSKATCLSKISVLLCLVKWYKNIAKWGSDLLHECLQLFWPDCLGIERVCVTFLSLWSSQQAQWSLMGLLVMQHRQAAQWAKFRMVMCDPEWVGNSSMFTNLVRDLLCIFIHHQMNVIMVLNSPLSLLMYLQLSKIILK